MAREDDAPEEDDPLFSGPAGPQPRYSAPTDRSRPVVDLIFLHLTRGSMHRAGMAAYLAL